MPGDDHRCKIDAKEKEYIKPNGIKIILYVPVIGNNVIEGYTRETGERLRPALEFHSHAIDKAFEICKACDLYKVR